VTLNFQECAEAALIKLSEKFKLPHYRPLHTVESMVGGAMRSIAGSYRPPDSLLS
jgi:hypothetical protein